MENSHLLMMTFIKDIIRKEYLMGKENIVGNKDLFMKDFFKRVTNTERVR